MAEKKLSEVPRPVRELYDRGQTALQRHNWDYAITIFEQVLQKEPGFYECREALRAVQFKKAEQGKSFFRRVLGSASNSPLFAKAQYLTRNNPVEAIHVLEQILHGDPTNTLAHKMLAEAALELNLPRTAVLSLEIAYRNVPGDKDIGLRLGRALIRSGQIARAEAMLSELQKVHPHDMDVAQAAKDASAKRTLAEGGYQTIADGTGSYRDILKDKAEAVVLEQEKREHKSEDVIGRLIAEYESRLVNEPDNLKLARSLAELYAQKEDYDTASTYYRRIITREGASDPSLERAIAETTLRAYDQRIARLDLTQPEAAEQADRLRKEREEFRLKNAQERVERYPNDLQLRFELGQIYFERGMISEAIQEFQKAQVNPHRRIAALNFLGQCFAKRGMLDLAARTFQNALKEKIVFDDEKKELIYRLGCVWEGLGKTEQAIEQFKQIYEVDIGFRDVAAKVDAFYAGGGA